MEKINLVALGSITARNGFLNEEDIIQKFNNWNSDDEAQEWLIIMGYALEEIEYVKAIKVCGEKTDVQAQVTIKLKKVIDAQNMQVKLVSNLRGYNQIDKRWVDKYVELWNIPPEVTNLLKRYTGEIAPTISNPRDKRRMFADEFNEQENILLLDFLIKNKTLIVSDILKGRGRMSAEWMLVVQKVNKNARWILKPMNYVLNYYCNGDISITKRGNLKLGKITIQRKGGDAGRDTAKMLQFKMNPAELFTDLL